MNYTSNGFRVSNLGTHVRRSLFTFSALLLALAGSATPVFAQQHSGGEASLVLPDLSSVTFFGGMDGHTLLLTGIVVCILGLAFGMAMYMNLTEA